MPLVAGIFASDRHAFPRNLDAVECSQRDRPADIAEHQNALRTLYTCWGRSGKSQSP